MPGETRTPWVLQGRQFRLSWHCPFPTLSSPPASCTLPAPACRGLLTPQPQPQFKKHLLQENFPRKPQSTRKEIPPTLFFPSRPNLYVYLSDYAFNIHPPPRRSVPEGKATFILLTSEPAPSTMPGRVCGGNHSMSAAQTGDRDCGQGPPGHNDRALLPAERGARVSMNQKQSLQTVAWREPEQVGPRRGGRGAF